MQTRRRSMDAFNDKVRELKEKYLKPAQIDKYLLECQVQMPPSFMPDMPRGRASRRHALRAKIEQVYWKTYIVRLNGSLENQPESG